VECPAAIDVLVTREWDPGLFLECLHGLDQKRNGSGGPSGQDGSALDTRQLQTHDTGSKLMEAPTRVEVEWD